MTGDEASDDEPSEPRDTPDEEPSDRPDDRGTTIAEDELTVEGPDRSAGGRERDDREEVEQLRSELDDLRDRVDERTVDRDDFERDVRRYVRWRLRRGHARGWGPYLVLLYGTVMTLGAFYYLAGWSAVAAMVVIWLSTLGLYVFMLVTGALLEVTTTAAGLAQRLRRIRQ